MTIVDELVSAAPAVDAAPAADGTEVEGGKAAPGEPTEDAKMLLLEVIQEAMIAALDGGISETSSTFMFTLNDDGSISVKGNDESGTELEVVCSMDDLLAAMDE